MSVTDAKPRRVTIRDVAGEAGVSVSTVSNWLRGHSKHMTPRTESAVAAAVERLQFRPSVAARTLRGKPSRVLGIIVPSIMNPAFPALVRGAEDRAAASGYNLFLCNMDRNPDKAAELSQAMLDHGVDGLAFVYTVPAAFRAAGVPVAALMADGTEIDGLRAILMDNHGAMRQAAGHLWGLGHRRIGVATSAYLTTNGPHRVAALAAALADRGGELPDDLVHCDPVEPSPSDELAEVEVGRRAGLHLLSRPDRPTAICAVTDAIAIGVVRAAKELGLQVPRDVSVTGHDDLPLARIVEPPLTTLAVDLYWLGGQLVELLLTSTPPAEPSRVQPVLRPRISTGPAPGTAATRHRRAS